MNKNLLIKQNRQLFDKLHISELSNKRLKDEISSLKDIVAQLQAEIEQLKDAKFNNETITDTIAEMPIEAPEQTEPQTNEVVLSEDIEYGSKIIGEIVIEAALTSNKIKENNHPDLKELVNLILGKTEVSKGEILNIVSSEVSLSAKIQMIDDVKTQTFEYFKSILEQ